MAMYSQNVFEGQRIQLDGSTFDGNSFTNCVLVYGGGPLTFSNNTLTNTRWEFVDAAARTLGIISSFYQSGGGSKQFVEHLLNGFGKGNVETKPSAEGE